MFITSTEIESLLESRYIQPQRLVIAGFEFEFKKVESCLEYLII